MLDDILPPFEFTVEFLLLVVAWGSAIEAARTRPHASRLRILTTLGFAVVGVAQFLLGLHVLGDDAGLRSSLIRGAGYVLILGGLIRAPAPVSTFALLPLAALPANAALASAAAAILVAVRGAMIHARDQRPETFSFATAFVFLGAAEALHVVAGDGWLVARYSARGLGSFLLLAWLFGRFNSIRVRFATRAIVSLVAGLLFLAAGFNVVISRTLTEETRGRLAEAASTRIRAFDELEAEAVTRAAVLANGFTASLTGERDPQATANSVISLLDPADLLVLVDETGRAVASAEPVSTGAGDQSDVVARRLPRTRTVPIAGSVIVVEALERGLDASRLERLTYTNAQGVAVNELNVLGAVPIRAEDRRRPIGALVVGYRIDAEEIGRLARDTGTIAALRIAGELATVRGPDGRPSPLEPDVRAQLAGVPAEPAGEPRNRFLDLELRDRRYIVVEAPIVQAGVSMGSLLLVTSPDALAGVLTGLTRVLFFLLIIALIVSAGYALRAGRRVTQPLVALTEASLALRAGDLTARAEVTGDDEIRTLSAAFNAMAIDLEAATSDLRASVEEETALRGRLEAIVQSMGDALIAVDGEGRVTTINRAAERLLGVSVEDATGASLAEILDGRTSDGESLAAAVIQEPSGAGSLRRDRMHRLIAFESRPLPSAFGRGGRVVVVRDETETRQAERMKDEFLANVSHELRTPLTPIRGFADILTRKDVPREKAAEYLRKILESSLRLERIVDILVDFAAIEAGRLTVRSEALPVAELIRERGREWTELEPDRDVRTRVQRGVGRVLGDPAIVIRALDELIDNAMKFSEGPVTIIASREDGRTPLIRIAVSDRGAGIPEDRIADIFRGFQQVNGTETREIGGLGLGLAFVKRAIEHIGGTVEVDSEVGRGTEVSIVLPEASDPPKRPVKRAGGSRRNHQPAGKARSA